MKQKLFDRKKYPKKCGNCLHGTQSDDGRTLLCKKRGAVDPCDVCRHYKYDPLKREPQQPIFHSDFTADDFKL